MTHDDPEFCTAIKNDGQPCTFKAKYSDGKCGIHTDETADTDPGGQPTLFTSRRRTQAIERAKLGATLRGCARAAGVTYRTLRNWLDEGEESGNEDDEFFQFFQAFTRARASGESELLEAAARDDPKFVLERSYGYVKTEKREVEMDADVEHSFDAEEGVTADFLTFDEPETDNE